MRKFWTASAAAAAITVALAARAGTYIPVPMVPGAVSQIVFSINNHKVVAGSFRDSAGVEHGFFGPLDGSSWTVFDFPGEGTTGTEPRYIADDGSIDGFATNPTFKVGEEFYRAPDGTFTVFLFNGQPLDGVAQGLNASDANVGDYINTDGKTLGYTGQSGIYLKDFKLYLHGNGKFLRVSPRGIDDLGQAVAGLFVDQNGIQHGFWQSQPPKTRPEAHEIDYPNSTGGTALEDINEKGVVSGQWLDAEGNTHAFTLNLGKRRNNIVDLDPEDGSISQQAWGVNDHGLVAVSTSLGRSYVYCPKKTPEKCPAIALTVDRYLQRLKDTNSLAVRNEVPMVAIK